MDGLSAAGHTSGSFAIAGMASFDDIGAECEPVLFCVGIGRGWILHVFNPAGVLHDPRCTGISSADWCMARQGGAITGERTSKLKNLVMGPVCNGWGGFDSRHRLALIFENAGARARSGGTAQEKP